MKTKKGFTLAELLVALACSAVVLLGVLSTFGIVTTLQKRAIDTAEATHQLPVLRDYICQNNITTDAGFVIRNGTVAYNRKVIVIGTNITSITFTIPEENGTPYIICCISEGDRHYEFIVPDAPPADTP